MDLRLLRCVRLTYISDVLNIGVVALEVNTIGHSMR
jgi:hypothetical protein